LLALWGEISTGRSGGKKAYTGKNQPGAKKTTGKYIAGEGKKTQPPNRQGAPWLEETKKENQRKERGRITLNNDPKEGENVGKGDERNHSTANLKKRCWGTGRRLAIY